jgi:hypothetical protein
MNRTGTMFFTAALFLGLAGCTGKGGQKNSDSNVEYYRNLLFSETPFDTERGTHKLTAEESKSINSYKFTKDNSGRLLTVEFLRGDSLLDYSSMDGAAKIAYEYKDGKQIKTWYNKKNERTESEGVYAAEYTLNDNGVRNGMMFLGKNGEMVENRNKIHNYVWSILPDSAVRELRYNLKGEETVMNPFCPFYELRFSYNKKGYVTRLANYKADTLYNCTAENCGDIGVSYFTFTTNDEGDVENMSVYNVKGQMSNLYWGWSKRLAKYDQNGYATENAYLDQDNEYVGGKNPPVYQMDYDGHGSVTEVRTMDKERKLINNPENGIAVTRYKYDAVGNRTETLTFDKDGVEVKAK